jgi:hypothetical protein
MIAFVQQIEVELRGQYALTYTSTSPDNRVQIRPEAIEKPAGRK